MDIHKACVSVSFSPALSVRRPGTPVSTCWQRCTTTSLEACVEPVMSWQWHSLPVTALYLAAASPEDHKRFRTKPYTPRTHGNGRAAHPDFIQTVGLCVSLLRFRPLH